MYTILYYLILFLIDKDWKSVQYFSVSELCQCPIWTVFKRGACSNLSGHPAAAASSCFHSHTYKYTWPGALRPVRSPPVTDSLVL